MDVAFIGLGRMGAPMALRLAGAGHRVRGHDLVARELKGVLTAASAADAATGADAVVLMLPTSADVHWVAVENGVLEAMGSRVLHVGPVGAGHALKALNNLLSATHLLATAEAVAIGRRFGLDPKLMVEVINTSSGASVSTAVKYPNYILNEAFNSGFGAGLMVKDVGIAVGLGEELGVPAALGEQTLELWREDATALPADADHTEIARWIDARY